MNGKQQEKIERLLKGGEVPEPPAQLLQKIKSEIPERLPQPKARTSRWVAWRIAASLLLLVGFGYIAFRTGQTYDFSRDREPDAAYEPVPTVVPEVKKSQPAPKEVSALAKNEATAAEGPPASSRQPVGRRRSPETAVLQERLPAAPRDEQDRRAVGGVEGGVVGGVVGGQLGGVIGDARESITVTSEAPMRSKMAAPAAALPPPPSTGGTEEPNAQPYGDVFFKHYGVNPFIDTEVDARSTFGLDVDTASYSIARRYLLEGNLPPAESVRPEEFLNSFDYGDEPPSRDDFAIYVEGAESLFPRAPRYAMLRFGIRAREIPSVSRAPAVLTFVVDTSGSMAQQNRIQLVKDALRMLLDQLREDDEVGLVIFRDQATVLLEPTADHEAIREAIARLRPAGSTNAGEGLRLGYEVAADAFRRGANNRVVFLSDGVANVGTTRAEDILKQVERFKNRGILLNSVGVGMGNFNDVLLEQIADKGNGTYAYIDDLEEAHRLFVENLTGTLQTVAEDARVQVEFNPRTVQSYRLIGYENRDIADERFRDDATDAGEIGAGHRVTALYEVKVHERARAGDHLATLTLRYRPSDRSQFRETVRRVPVSAIARSWESAPRSFQLATIVATFAEMLRESHWTRHVDPAELEERVELLVRHYRADQRVQELERMVERAVELWGPLGE